MADLNLVGSYDYELPSELIASAPAMPKQSVRLLIYDRAKEQITHARFGDLADALPPCDIIFNDTRVIKARLFGRKNSGGKIELLLNSPLAGDKFSAYIRGSVKADSELSFEAGLNACVCELMEGGLRIVQFERGGKALNTHDVFEICEKIGHVPLPPYIKRADTKEDASWYQSIFAREQGAVAAPTASLHFDSEMIADLRRNHEIHFITLHVGAGTFQPVKTERLSEHQMHAERYDVPAATQEAIAACRARGGRVVFARPQGVVLAQGSGPEQMLSVPPSTRTRIGCDAPDDVRRHILAAVAAAWALNLPTELVHAGLLHMRKSVAMSAYH